MVLKKATVQVLLLLIGMAMLVFGIWRGEAQTVFQRQFDCVWSVLELAKKKQRNKKKVHLLARFRGWIQAGATLLTNIHLPNF